MIFNKEANDDDDDDENDDDDDDDNDAENQLRGSPVAKRLQTL